MAATVKPVMQGKAAETSATAKATGLKFERFFTDGKNSPFDAVEWEKRTALIGNEKGVTIFRQEDVDVPKNWSQTATNIVASKYFHGKPGTSGARRLGAATDRPCGEHHCALGRRRRVLSAIRRRAMRSRMN